MPRVCHGRLAHFSIEKTVAFVENLIPPFATTRVRALFPRFLSVFAHYGQIGWWHNRSIHYAWIVIRAAYQTFADESSGFSLQPGKFLRQLRRIPSRNAGERRFPLYGALFAVEEWS